ncbi:hypothetical protein GE09DRAFT_284745 [Coniochaeta sp. 2T2.1]|nr:hypothetical protein GE09DRAFT_284745 [Coniochaeta sp. 2T2.1]
MIWNGQVFDHSCLLDRPFNGDHVCGDMLPADLSSLSGSDGESVQGNGDGSDYPPGHMPIDGPLQTGPTITFLSGTPFPTCTTQCGKLCTGFYCDPSPTGPPPDFNYPVNVNTSSVGTPTATTAPSTTPVIPTGKSSVSAPTTVPTPASNPSTTPNVLTDMPPITTRRPTETHATSCVASGAVSTCSMGPGGQKACVTSTACVWQAESAAGAPPPPPSPTPDNVFVGITQKKYVHGGDSATYVWEVFSRPLNESMNFCTDEPVFSLRSGHQDNSFPPSLGPFNAHGFSCSYKGTPDKMGLLECDGVQNMWCQDVRHPELLCKLLRVYAYPAVLCRW